MTQPTIHKSGGRRLRFLDLFCGRFGWGKEFAKRGHTVFGVDLMQPAEVPIGCEYIAADILDCGWERGAFRVWARGCPVAGQMWISDIDFIVASPPCEKFSVFGMPHFFPTPPYPELGIKLFNHTREICEASGLPYIMENVRAAQKFVGNSVHRCGPFHLWGNGVPPLMPQGISKGMTLHMARNPITGKRILAGGRAFSSKSKQRKEHTALLATIPPELANCVADYAERICNQQELVGR